MLARIQIEQAEVDLDVAVGGLQCRPARECAPRARVRSRIVIGEPGQLQREIGLDRRADLRRPLRRKC